MHDSIWSCGNRLRRDVTTFIHACATAVEPDVFIAVFRDEDRLLLDLQDAGTGILRYEISA